ncbi:arginase family protein, partial [Limosilactobacillus fermentum]|nr:arginase family protein [Limosilactobacillus fermentum]
DPADFPAAVGQLTLPEVANLLTQLDQSAELVGLAVAEYMAWDALNLRQSLSGLSLLE